MSIEAMKQVKQELEHIKQYGYATDIDHAIKTLGHAIVEAQKQGPTTLCGPNLEQILNAAGFYRQPEHPLDIYERAYFAGKQDGIDETIALLKVKE